MAQTVTADYLDGIRDARAWFKQYGMDGAQSHLDTIERVCRQFGAHTPVGQGLRGERDFWRHQIKKQSKQA